MNKFEWNENQLETINGEKLYNVVNTMDCIMIGGMCEIMEVVDANKNKSAEELVSLIKDFIEMEAENCMRGK